MMPLILAAAAIYALTLKRDEKAAGKIQLNPNNISYNKAEKKMYLNVEILNPTNTPFKIDSLFLTIANNGKKLGTVERFTPFEVTKLGRSIVKFPIVISPTGLGNFIADTVIKKNPVNIDAKGDLRYKGLVIPISEKLDFKEI